MKLTVNIDCTPQEMRQVLGLPDVEALNAMIVAELTRRAQEEMDTLADPKKFVARMAGASSTGMDAIQALMMAAMKGGGGSGSDK